MCLTKVALSDSQYKFNGISTTSALKDSYLKMSSAVDIQMANTWLAKIASEQRQRIVKYRPFSYSNYIFNIPRKCTLYNLIYIYIYIFYALKHVGDIFMYIPCVLCSLLSRPTNAHYLYTNNILYIVSTPARFDASASSSGSLNNFHVL
jgi:hypothetical protein